MVKLFIRIIEFIEGLLGRFVRTCEYCLDKVLHYDYVKKQENFAKNKGATEK